MLDIPLFETLRKKVPSLENNWERYMSMIKLKKVPAKTLLIRKGEFVKTIFFVKKGCLRIRFEEPKRDITIAFFFENRVITSLHSYRGNYKESGLSLESIEPTELLLLSGEDAETIYRENEGVKDLLLEYTLERFDNYLNLFLSRIRDSPEKRYINLVKEHPDIATRIPQHYIASYLGITPVSLSRIRNRIWKEQK
ncbi:Crp/Fnr family transcriptional regulator [Leptospira sarikeiensis]|uniref:Crp/Fnr family transcriptional regulator n=1 Tax=Leptospira sarikeiensis TaxID=2484943 RepID=A0A4R9JYR1_9LEPT|nr:Crp/Fnr family transcriptional regulator [Leptospira sarikeiensis]TGL58407.1 Crp/Fnr family transcriptional regulator [Leptospira sarikeiensis]